MENLINNQWVCYILKSNNPLHNNKTYIGSTNNIKRRIKQHNGILVGGAKATKIMRPNEIICVLTGFPHKIAALKCEWLLKHPNGTYKNNNKYYGIIGRLKGINYLLNNSEKWKLRSENCLINIWIKKEYVEFLDINLLPSSVKIYSC